LNCEQTIYTQIVCQQIIKLTGGSGTVRNRDDAELG